MLVKEKGFSLLELMMTLVVLAILLGIGVPSFQSLMESSRLRSVTYDLNTAVQLARSEAISRRQTAAACRANAAGTACDFTNNDWSGGWLVVLQNGADLATPANVQVVRGWGAIELAAFGAAQGFVFNRSGLAQAAASIDISNNRDSRCLNINIGGSVSVKGEACP